MPESKALETERKRFLVGTFC